MRTVFLSSTSKDLTAHREAAYRAIESLDDYHCVRMEDFGARSQQADDLCTAKVKQSNLIVFLIGPLYGSRNPKGISYTESEYETAVACQKQCLVLMTADDFPLPASLREPDESTTAQKAFREKLQQIWTVKFFSRVEEVPGFVTQAIANWQAGQSVSALRWRTLAPIEVPSWTRVEGTVFSVGRSPDSSIFLSDPGVSWEHGNIFRRKGAFWYRHLSSVARSFLFQRGGDRMLKPGDESEILLQNQDRLKVGDTTIVLQFDLVGVDATWSPTAPPPDC
jgi:hypothetical protein